MREGENSTREILSTYTRNDHLFKKVGKCKPGRKKNKVQNCLSGPYLESFLTNILVSLLWNVSKLS